MTDVFMLFLPTSFVISLLFGWNILSDYSFHPSDQKQSFATLLEMYKGDRHTSLSFMKLFI